jgi:histone-lysine N-methyltransferase SETD1
MSQTATLKRKRLPSPAASSSQSSRRLTNGASLPSSASATANGEHYTSPDSDEMQTSDTGDMLRGVGSASSLGSTVSSVFSHNSHSFAINSKASASGYTPLTTHTDSSPPKGSSPRLSKPATEMASLHGAVASTSHLPPSDTTPDPPQQQRPRPQMLPPPGKAKGYRAVWDPELDNKLSREERKRAAFKKRDFGAVVRYTFHILLSLHNITHMT